MFCQNCGTECEGKFCPNCGTKIESPKAPQSAQTMPPQDDDLYIELKDPKGKWAAFTLCLLLGWLGAHRFYTRKYISAAVYILLLFVFPYALPLCILYDLFTIINNSFFWDHKKMVARYQASENKSKIDAWMIDFGVLALLFAVFLLAGHPFASCVEMVASIGIPAFGILTLDAYRKGKPYVMPLIFFLLCFVPFLASAAGLTTLSV